MKKLSLVSAAGLALAGLSVTLLTQPLSAQATNTLTANSAETTELNRIIRGFKAAPVPLNLEGKDLELVGLGSYLANGPGGCNDCHTNPSFAPGGNPFLGQPKKINSAHYLAGGQLFGPFVSRNLTPENGLPGGRTYAEFVQIMRKGTDYDHVHPQYGPLLQVMPWPSYQNMTNHDLRAIYEYLRAIPPATPGTTPSAQ